MNKKSFVCMIISIAMILCMVVNSAFSETDSLSETQQNAIAMLNHITVLTKEINTSKNSRVFMEEAYSSLVNNTYPNAVDSRTLSQLMDLLDTMESYRMLSVKRDRLEYIYEQNQAQAIRSAVPNPLGLLSAVQSMNPAAIISSVIYMAVDSYTSYESASTEAELQYLKDGWALDDEEATMLHNSRKSAFSYMVNMVGEYHIPGDLTLTENAVDEFVDWKNNENTVARIRFLESNRKTYESYGGYWLTLAESYYQNGDFQKCLDAIASYDAISSRIFRRDYDLAAVLPLAIVSAENVLEQDAYVKYAAEKAQLIINNSDNDEWALRYLAAQTFIGLYGKTNNPEYLEKAYQIALDNVNYLVGEQKKLNSTFLAAVKEEEKPAGTPNDEKKEIDKYNTMLKETRKTELAPVYEPLVLNCDLLFSLAVELEIPEAKEMEIDDILHAKGEELFLIDAIDDKYWFVKPEKGMYDAILPAYFTGTEIGIPVPYVSNESTIVMSIQDNTSDQEKTLTEWELSRVERSQENDITAFTAFYKCKELEGYYWTPETKISVTIKPCTDSQQVYQYEFLVTSAKNTVWEWLGVWNGYKPNWYDYLAVWSNGVNFERVE